MTSPVSPELSAKITEWRTRVVTNDLSAEEMKQAIRVLRAGRLNAASAPDAAKRGKAKKEIKSAEDLLGELGALGGGK